MYFLYIFLGFYFVASKEELGHRKLIPQLFLMRVGSILKLTLYWFIGSVHHFGSDCYPTTSSAFLLSHPPHKEGKIAATLACHRELLFQH